MIPVAHQCFHAGQRGKNRRHTGGKRYRAAGPARKRFADHRLHFGKMYRRKTEFFKNARRHVDREIITRHHNRCGYKREYGDYGLYKHGTVAYHSYVAFAAYHFRRGAGTYKAVETAYRAAGYRNADERPYRAGNYRAAAMNIGSNRRHLQDGIYYKNTGREQRYRSDFHVRTQVIARA